MMRQLLVITKRLSKADMYLVLALPQNGPKGVSEEFYSFDYGNCHLQLLIPVFLDNRKAAMEEEWEQQLTAISSWLSKT